MTNHRQKTFILLLSYIFSIISFIIFTNNSFAWSGYDFDEKTDIDIGEGNLVREGLVIQFYDSKTDSYHNAKVLLLEYEPGGTMLQVEDLELQKVRTLIMQN